MNKNIEIIEVCPRDGFQNVKTPITTEHKLEIVKQLMDCGFQQMEVASFVSPKWLPQMADAAEVVAGAKKYRDEKNYHCKLIGLAPNSRGIDNAVAAGVDAIMVPISAIERHNRDNVNRTREDSFAELEKKIQEYSDMEFTVGLACALGSPYGPSDPVIKDELFQMVTHCQEIGVKHITIPDTVGNGTPLFVEEIFSELNKYVDYSMISLHLHDSLGRSLVNTMVALNHGITQFESAAGGLGGCPYAPGAAGNVATEDLITFFESLNIDPGIALDDVFRAVGSIAQYVDAPVVSHAYQFYHSPCNK
ncbi:MAG: hydroxymethylglutaryl-CoA lyase [Clostridiales bacterium]|nr:hydroxymethylglutaryl-CoA lyase [Clostridiales bacterium]